MVDDHDRFPVQLHLLRGRSLWERRDRFSGNLFQTATYGGANDAGTVFEVSNGVATLLATFNGTDGANPEGGVVLDSSGNLFGTTLNGGTYGYGTVFEVAQGTDSITTLHSLM